MYFDKKQTKSKQLQLQQQPKTITNLENFTGQQWNQQLSEKLKHKQKKNLTTPFTEDPKRTWRPKLSALKIRLYHKKTNILQHTKTETE